MIETQTQTEIQSEVDVMMGADIEGDDTLSQASIIGEPEAEQAGEGGEGGADPMEDSGDPGEEEEEVEVPLPAPASTPESLSQTADTAGR